MTHQKYLQQAIELADNNVLTHHGGPFGAIIVQNDQLISEGVNCVTQNIDPTAHAEIMAIRRACKTLDHFNLNDCILYSSCEPCPMCLGAIYWARLKKVYYACSRQDAKKAGFDDDFIYHEIALDPNQRHIAMVQLSLASTQKPFHSWQGQKDKIIY